MAFYRNVSLFVAKICCFVCCHVWMISWNKIKGSLYPIHIGHIHKCEMATFMCGLLHSRGCAQIKCKMILLLSSIHMIIQTKFIHICLVCQKRRCLNTTPGFSQLCQPITRRDFTGHYSKV